MSIDLSPVQVLSLDGAVMALALRLNNLIENIEIIGDNRYLAVKEEVEDAGARGED